MKKTILILLSILMIFTASCNGGSTEIDTQPTRPLELDMNEEATLNINVPIIYKSATQWNFELFRDRYDDLDSWYDLIKEEINYIASLYAYDIANSKYYIEKIQNDELSGLILVETGNFNNIPDLRDQGLIYPLDELLKDNANFNLMPEEMRNAYRLPDGNIWALPAGYNNSLYGRHYNKEWLSKLELNVPDSLDSFYEVSKAFAYNDPNGNGINDDKGLAGKNWDGPEMFGDIFLAYDCYLSNFFQTSVAYDYKTGAYEDAVLKPEMEEALTFIKALLSEKIVKVMQNYDFRTSGTCGSYYGLFSEMPDEDIWTMSYSLIPDKLNSAMGKGPEKCFVLTSNTLDKEQSLNAFINSFYSDIKGIALGKYGQPGKNYEITDRELTLMSNPYMNILGDMPYITRNYVDTIKYDLGYETDNGAKYYETYSSLYNSGKLIVDTDDFLPHIGGTEAQWAFGGYFAWYFLDIYESMGTEEFLTYFKAEMKKIGIQDILDKLNEEAGTIASYSYN